MEKNREKTKRKKNREKICAKRFRNNVRKKNRDGTKRGKKIVYREDGQSIHLSVNAIVFPPFRFLLLG